MGDLSRFDDAFLEQRFGKWGLALAGKSRGEDAGGWFDTEVGADTDPKSISHEHTYNEDTAAQEQLESTLMRLSEMVGRRLREVLHDGLRRWSNLPRKVREPGSVKVPDLARTGTSYAPTLPPAGLVVTVYTRLLDRDA